MKRIANACFFAWIESEIGCGRSVRFRVKGNSMLPFLRGGYDDVVVAPCRPGEAKRWDVVLFRYRGRHILHRIVGKEGTCCRMQGDGVCYGFEECREEDIIGVVKRIYHPSGRIVDTASFSWRLQSRLWQGTRRFRKILLRLHGH